MSNPGNTEPLSSELPLVAYEVVLCMVSVLNRINWDGLL